MARAEDTYRKSSPDAPDGYFHWEASGLRWLAQAPDGVPVVQVVGVGAHHLDLARLESAQPSRAAARALGAGLAHTHDAGAPAYGAGPEGWDGDGFLGPLSEPLPLTLRPSPSWGEFYAEQRVLATLRMGRHRGTYGAEDAATFQRLAERLAGGDFDTSDEPARLHGDLWSGNLMWTPGTAVLIDPAAHGGHRETDLAMLALFGAPYLDEVIAGYQAVHPLASGWQGRVEVHQVHPLMVHAVLFGGGYVSRSVQAARRYV